jgi:flagellar basal-body rod protein FlgC
MFDSMHISASGLAAERLRMDVIAQNLANVNTTRGPNGQPYRRQEVLFESIDTGIGTGMAGVGGGDEPPKFGVHVAGVVDDPSAMRTVYDPSHPDADANGIVTLPNVNPVTEMVDMMTATRAYEANVTAMNAAKNMALKALDILR